MKLSEARRIVRDARLVKLLLVGRTGSIQLRISKIMAIEICKSYKGFELRQSEGVCYVLCSESENKDIRSDFDG